MKIDLVISSLRAGGAERVISWLANSWSVLGSDVRVITLDGGRIKPHYSLADPVSLESVNCFSGEEPLPVILGRCPGALFRLRSLVKQRKPEIVISFLTGTNLFAISSLLGTGVPLLISERIDPSAGHAPVFRRILQRLLYGRARMLVVQSKSARAWYQVIMKRRIAVIPNAAILPESENMEKREEVSTERVVCAVGRLEEQKGFDFLIRAFSRIAPINPDWKLIIAGEGSERSRLEELVGSLKLQDRISLPGQIDSPYPLFRRSAIFVLPSRYEGFPNVLVEAMAAGKAVIAFDCPGAVGEIIHHGENGLLCEQENESALAEAVGRLIRDSAESERLAVEAQKVCETYSEQSVFGLWVELVESLTTGNKKEESK